MLSELLGVREVEGNEFLFSKWGGDGGAEEELTKSLSGLHSSHNKLALKTTTTTMV